MTCENNVVDLDDYIDGYLDAKARSDLDLHISVCHACKASLAQRRELRAELRALPVMDWSVNTARAAIARAVAAKAPRRPAWYLAGVGAALAAGLAIALVSTLLLPAQKEADVLPLVHMRLDEVRQVDLVFDAPRNVGTVQFVVFLPENAELQGFPGQRRVEWQATLGAGANLLPLSVLATGVVNGELVARLSHNGESKEFKVRLDAGRDDRAYAPSSNVRYRT